MMDLGKSHKRWYHGTQAHGVESIQHEGVIRPGMPTRYRQDIPRWDAVYVTSDPKLANVYAESGGTIFEVEVDEKKLLPDEDTVFSLLLETSAKPTQLEREVQKAYRDYMAEVGAAEFGVYGMEEEAREWTEATVEESMRSLHEYAELMAEDPFSTGLAEKMKDVAEWIAHKNPELARNIIKFGGVAAHIGPVKVVGEAKDLSFMPFRRPEKSRGVAVRHRPVRVRKYRRRR